MQDKKPRQIAARVLRQVSQHAAQAEQLLEDALLHSPLNPPDRALAQELTFGVIRWQATLDWLIARKTLGRQQKVTLQILLRLGLYQMFWLTRIPDHAAIHESVQLAKELGFGPQAGFVNAVLRGYARERTATQQLLEQLKQEQPALGYSHPAWLCERWQARWSSDPLRRLLAWNNTPPRNFARLNTLRATSASLQAAWAHEQVQSLPRSWDWIAPDLVYELVSHPPPPQWASLQEGLFYIQDPSTLLAVQALDPQPGDSILDACAAPGGKTTFIAQLMRNQGSVLALDVQEQRLQLVGQNCARLGILCVQTSLAAPHLDPPPAASFDRVLLDVPCSNTGVMRRRIELRWRVRPEELKRLTLLQQQLLDRFSHPLKPDGILVYSTCSLEPEENQLMIQNFLSRHPNFTLERERELLPFVEGVDGAYVARLRRTR